MEKYHYKVKVLIVQNLYSDEENIISAKTIDQYSSLRVDINTFDDSIENYLKIPEASKLLIDIIQKLNENYDDFYSLLDIKYIYER